MKNKSASVGALVGWMLFVVAIIGFSHHARAEETRDSHADSGLNPFKDVLDQSLNEHIDPFSGTPQLKHTDAQISAGVTTTAAIDPANNEGVM